MKQLRWLALAVVLPVSAQHVYKCETAGETVYQSRPCPSGVASRTWDASEPVVSPARQAQIQRERAQAQRRDMATRRERGRAGPDVAMMPSYAPRHADTSEVEIPAW